MNHHRATSWTLLALSALVASLLTLQAGSLATVADVRSHAATLTANVEELSQLGDTSKHTPDWIGQRLSLQP